MNFRVWPAWADFGHLPKIVLAPEEEQVLRIKPRLLQPALCGFVIFRHNALFIAEAGGPQAVFGQAPYPGEQLPRPRDCILLVIVAKGPVAEHLKESVMGIIPAHIIQVVVFAGDAHALLRVRCAAVRAGSGVEEHVLKLHHARVCEQQCGIVSWNERGRWNDGMAALGEEIEE